MAAPSPSRRPPKKVRPPPKVRRCVFACFDWLVLRLKTKEADCDAMRQTSQNEEALQDTIARLSRAIEEIQRKNASKLSFEEQSVAWSRRHPSSLS